MLVQSTSETLVVQLGPEPEADFQTPDWQDRSAPLACRATKPSAEQGAPGVT